LLRLPFLTDARRVFAIPLFDDSVIRKQPILLWLLIGACGLVFLWQMSLPPRSEQAIAFGLGVVPAVLFGEAELPASLRLVPPWATLVTSQFLHAGFFHLGGNMLYLWIFGRSVEGAVSRPRFLFLYLASGIMAGLAQSLSDPHSSVPMIGASGAIAGVLGAYLILQPQANVRVLIFLFVFVRLINVPAAVVLGLWIAIQILSGVTAPSGEGGVAFVAHVAGFATGVVMIPFLKDTGVPLLAGPRTAMFQLTRPRDHRRGSVPEAGGGFRRGPWG
jgi:membrane associated rhomboid family serine protease